MSVHSLNKDVSHAIIGTFFKCLLQKIVGRVVFVVFSRFMLNFKRLKCDGQCLFLSYCDSYFACEKWFLKGRGMCSL